MAPWTATTASVSASELEVLIGAPAPQSGISAGTEISPAPYEVDIAKDQSAIPACGR